LYRLAGSAPTSSEAAGKVMALAAYGCRREPTPMERDLSDAILSLDRSELWSWLFTRAKSRFDDSPYCGIGVEAQASKDLMWQFSSALFERFSSFAKEHVTPGLPLLISGGCGLNCDWNSQWRSCGLFSEIFVPPCPNDSGVALGAAIDALHHYTGRAKIDWSVYAGDSFIEDVDTPDHFDCCPLSLERVCKRLLAGDVIAWVQGRSEMGPRALGNRSLLAEPFSPGTRDKLNRIKQREGYRPVAPICLEEDFDRHFENQGPSPHMLYFQRVRSPKLAAITHVDGSARGQSVNDSENPAMCALLREFRRQSGVAVLCNTSLNFKGRGFINRLSDLFVLAQERGLDGLVVGNRYWTRKRPLQRPATRCEPALTAAE
jgi:predicted NodU family carbamoyl transferase